MAVTIDNYGKEWKRLYTASLALASTSNTSDEIIVSDMFQGTFQFIWATATDTGSVAIQSSLDGTNWDTVSGTTVTTSGASGSASLYLSQLPGNRLRVKVTEADAAGTMVIWFEGRRS